MDLSIDALPGEDIQYLIEECSDNIGLYNGKTGLCMYYFIQHDIFNNEEHLSKAKEMLNEVGAQFAETTHSGFSEGIGGIGWALEWIIQNKFDTGDTDDILHDVDDALYKMVVYTMSPGLSLPTGTLGMAQYFYKRLMAKNGNTNRLRKICNLECLVLLLDEIDHFLADGSKGLLTMTKYDPASASEPHRLFEIGQSLIFLEKCIEVGVNREMIGKLICRIGAFIDHYSEDMTEQISRQMQRSFAYLLYAWYKVGYRINDSGWVNAAISRYNRYFNGHPLLVNIDRLKTIPDLYEGSRVYTLLSLLARSSGYERTAWEEAWLL